MKINRAAMVVLIMGFLVNLLFGGASKSPSNLPALIKDGALVIDVRSAGEFAGGHIDGAINIPHTIILKEITKHETDKTKVIIVYCRSGNRSSIAKKALEDAGYANVINGGSLGDMRKALSN